MIITFPTKPGMNHQGPQPPLGLPKRADPCRCAGGARLTEPEETCLRCGHYEEETINTTWRDRARQIARREKPMAEPMAVAA